MKRGRKLSDYELSDTEWAPAEDSFKPSRVLKVIPPKPPIQSFAFTKIPPNISPISRPQNLNQPANISSISRPLQIDLSSDDDDEKDTSALASTSRGRIDLDEDLEDDDVEVGVKDTSAVSSTSRGRRFVIEEDEEEEDEKVGVIEVKSDEEYDDIEFEDEDDEDEVMEEEEDVVRKALQKCGKISAELKKELYGTTAAACERYSQVEEAPTSSMRIVTQDDITEACGEADSDFKPELKPYQLVGVNFLLLLYRKKIGGAILADEMGLGKTIQAITYLILLKHLNGDPGPHLIVCPASVLENWERELRKWCPSFTVLQYHGTTRSSYSKELSSLGKAGLPPPFNVILVCYSLFERHSAQQKDDRKVLRYWRWSCVLMDEAHALKDKSSYRWKNLMSVARKAKQRLMLTGTPLQNDLQELWSMLEFMMPDLFETGDTDLKKLLNSEDRDLIAQMKSIIGPFILRRLKSDVMQQLVRKTQMVEYVHMDKEQDDAYNEAIQNYRAASQARLAKTSAINLNNIAAVMPKRQISNYFLEFRKIANHPLLVRRLYRDEDILRYAKVMHPKGVFGFECTLERVIEELKSYSDYSIHKLLLYYGDSDTDEVLTDEHVLVSAKCRALAKLLPKLKNAGHRVLIFSQWTSMLDILEWALDVIGATYRRLDGSTQVTERQSIVDTFNKDPTIFACLLSTRAGGQGLNLTGADTVIIHDMDFNPQIDRQAEDRCHRIGQTKPVTVYRLVTKNTVDENVYEIAKRKLTLDAAMLETGEEVVSGGDMPDKTMAEILSSLLLA